MARKRVIEEPTLKSWEDVNDALRQIAEAQIALGDIESDMQKQIIGAQKVAEEQSKPIKDALKKYGEDTVNAVGATWKQSDVFGYEVNIAKLEQIKAGN